MCILSKSKSPTSCESSSRAFQGTHSLLWSYQHWSCWTICAISRFHPSVHRGGQIHTLAWGHSIVGHLRHLMCSSFDPTLDITFRSAKRDLIRPWSPIYLKFVGSSCSVTQHKALTDDCLSPSGKRASGEVPQAHEGCVDGTPFWCKLDGWATIGSPWNPYCTEGRLRHIIGRVSLWISVVFLVTSEELETPQQFLPALRERVQSFRPTPTSRHGGPKSFVPQDLQHSQFVLCDAMRIGLPCNVLMKAHSKSSQRERNLSPLIVVGK